MTVDAKKEGIRISLAALLAWVPIAPVFWFLVKPILVSAVSEAMADDVATQIAEETAPIKGAFEVLIKQNTADLRRQIAEMEFRRDNPPADDWTADDAEDLVNLRLELESSQEALKALRGSS